MDGWWPLLIHWALWPTALSVLLGLAAFAVVLAPAEWFCGQGRSRHSFDDR